MVLNSSKSSPRRKAFRPTCGPASSKIAAARRGRGAAIISAFSSTESRPSAPGISSPHDRPGDLSRPRNSSPWHRMRREPYSRRSTTASRDGGLFLEDLRPSEWRRREGRQRGFSSIAVEFRGSPPRGHGILRWLGYREVQNWTIAQGLHDDVVWPDLSGWQTPALIADQFQINCFCGTDQNLTTPALFHRYPILHGTGFAQSPDGSLGSLALTGRSTVLILPWSTSPFAPGYPALARSFTDSSHRIWILVAERSLRHPQSGSASPSRRSPIPISPRTPSPMLPSPQP